MPKPEDPFAAAAQPHCPSCGTVLKSVHGWFHCDNCDLDVLPER